MQPEIEEVIAFTVPLVVPTGNHYKLATWRSGRPHYIITPEAKAYYDAVAIFARGRSVAKPKARYAVQIDVFLGPRQRLDFDNGFKCGLDALVRAGVIHSDAAVDGAQSNCIVHKDDRTNPRTEYLITRLEK